MQLNPHKQHTYFQNIADMKRYAKQNHLLLYVYKNNVYDLTQFAGTHPGGYEEIAKFGNTDIEKIIYNPQIHRHSPAILFHISKYQCGSIQQSLVRSKSSQLLIQHTRKELLSAADPDYTPVPEDCCIERVPSIKTHRRIFNSFETITLNK